jgi:non-specific serine/threonine protein kinase
MSQDHDTKERTSYSYRLGTAEFDEARFELRVAGLPVDVERRALEVFAYLLRHAGEVVTKEELLREVWAGRITVEKVLPNAVNKLRRALGETNAERLATIARVGYRIDGTVERTAVGRQPASQLELAADAPVPGRENFRLQRQLGSNRGSEVWLAEHAKTHERRVYKFAADGERLRALKREATLSRVLHESLDDRRHLVEIIDWNFENAPFFLECEFGGQSLLEWSDAHLASTGVNERLGLFLQIADTVAAAHGVGVLHKDLKPANVLIEPDGDGWRIRLTDFGSARLLDPERLEMLGITRLGLTLTQNLATDPSSGTPLYVAPEIFEGHTPTVRSDVFALGIMLYQLLAGHLTKPMASGWEADVADELLREDIRLATDGNPERRLASAAEFAARLRRLGERRALAAAEARADAQAKAARDALAKSRARKPYLIALVAALGAGVVVVLGLYQMALKARNAARQELDRATAINRFLNEDLIGRSNPLVVAKGQSASLKDVLLNARERVAKRFAAQPATEASIRLSLATLLNTIELLPEADVEARRALELYEAVEGASDRDALNARALVVRLLTRTAKFDEAKRELTTLDELAVAAPGEHARYLTASTWAMYYMNQREFPKALERLRVAIPALRQSDPGNVPALDALRVDLVLALTQTADIAGAQREGQSLVDDIAARADGSELQLALAQSALAKAYALDNQLDRAEPPMRAAYDTISRLLGTDHTRALMVLADLFDVAARRRDFPKAIDYAQRVYETARAKFGAEHNSTSVMLGNWALILYESGDSKAALPRIREAYERLSTALGAKSPHGQMMGFWLAAIELELGNLPRADELLRTLDAPTLETAGSDGMWQARLDALGGVLLDKRGDHAAAVPLLQRALAGIQPGAAQESLVYTNAKKALESPP